MLNSVGLNRCIFFGDSVIPDKISSLTDKILKLAQEDKTPIWLFINSPGGEGKITFGFYDLIRALSIPLHTVAAGEVGSSSVILFLADIRRFILPNSTIYLHEAMKVVGKEVRFLQAQLDEAARDMHRLIQTYVNIICDNSNLDSATVISMMQKETRFTAEDCVQYGIAELG